MSWAWKFDPWNLTLGVHYFRGRALHLIYFHVPMLTVLIDLK